jgi:hypothetical protein
MSLRISRRLRAVVALAAAAAYALQLGLGLLAELGHGAHHALEGLGEARQTAAALGLVHLHDDRAGSVAPAAPDSRPGAFVHSHGGETHSHDVATDALLFAAAATATDEDATDAGEVPTVKLSSHLPGGFTGPPPAAFSDAAPPSLSDAAPPSLRLLAVTTPSPTPTPPPPRA